MRFIEKREIKDIKIILYIMIPLIPRSDPHCYFCVQRQHYSLPIATKSLAKKFFQILTS